MELFAWISFAAAVLLGLTSLIMSFRIYTLTESLAHVREQRDSGSLTVKTERQKMADLERQLRDSRDKADQLGKSLELAESGRIADGETMKDLRAEVSQANARRDEMAKNRDYWKAQAEEARGALVNAGMANPGTASAGVAEVGTKASKVRPEKSA